MIWFSDHLFTQLNPYLGCPVFKPSLCCLSGLYHYFRKEYTEAIDLFQKSLNLNSFQLETLLRLGYSAIQTEAWDIAATTYWKYCSYESDVRNKIVKQLLSIITKCCMLLLAFIRTS